MQTQALVLAAGAGRRLRSVTGDVPKQFWHGEGGASLLEQTLDRLSPLVPARQTLTVVDQSHRDHVAALPRAGRLGELIYQPDDRGTAAGVLLGLLYIRARDSTVLLTPSDHGIDQAELYRDGLKRALRAAEAARESIVILGVAPQSAEGDYGWITPARVVGPSGVAGVAGFVEKPARETAEKLFKTGAVWNTMVLAAHRQALINAYRRHLPDLYDALAPAAQLSGDLRDEYVSSAYRTLPSYDFSRDLLARASRLRVMTWPAALGWSDLGTPERLAAWTSPERRRERRAPSAA